MSAFARWTSDFGGHLGFVDLKLISNAQQRRRKYQKRFIEERFLACENGNDLDPSAHERFSAVLSLDPSDTSGFARSVGDTNPLHHDMDYAAATRFGRLLASGPQTTAHLLALTASHFSKRGAMLGLEFWVQFRRPIYADETISLEWLVISVKKHPRLNGEVIDLRGRIRKENGETAVGAKGRVLVTPQH